MMVKQAEFPDINIQRALLDRGFKVGRSKVLKSPASAFRKRHFYKIVLSIGDVSVLYGAEKLRLNGAYLFIANPFIPYSVEIMSEVQTGYSCLFTQEFLQPVRLMESLRKSVAFDRNLIPSYELNEIQCARISEIFEKMIAEESDGYEYKDDIMRLYISMILHETMKMKSDRGSKIPADASARITKDFLESLESQFPLENLNKSLNLHTPQDFANRMGIHVNSLNRALKKMTGNSTQALISSRIASEAKVLLEFTDWSVSEIAFALGFEYANYFSAFMKKNTGRTPRSYRKT